MGSDSHGRPSRKHGFREASDERRSGKRRDCHCECCCTKAKADDGQDETTAKHRPQTSNGRGLSLSASRNCTGGWLQEEGQMQMEKTTEELNEKAQRDGRRK